MQREFPSLFSLTAMGHDQPRAVVGANDNLSDASGKLGKTSGQQIAHSGPSVSMTWTQFSVPEVFRLSVETEQRMIRSSSRLERVITNIGGFLFSVNDQRGGIQVEEQSVRWPRHHDHLSQEPVVESPQPRQGRRRQTQEKSSQSRSIRVVREPAQVLKDSIDLQQMCCLDPFETENQRIKDRQQQFADAVAI